MVQAVDSREVGEGVNHRLTEAAARHASAPLPGRKHTKRMLGIDDAGPRWGASKKK
jgi:hypothetical protein